MGQKLGGMDHGYALLSGVSWVAVEHKVPWTEAYLRIIWHLSRLATTDMGRKWGLCPFWGRELGPHRIQCGRAETYLRAKFHLDPCSRLATIDVGCGTLGEGFSPFGGLVVADAHTPD